MDNLNREMPLAIEISRLIGEQWAEQWQQIRSRIVPVAKRGSPHRSSGGVAVVATRLMAVGLLDGDSELARV